MRIQEAQLDLSREALLRPFGFKGAAFTEKWISHVHLTSEQGHTGQDLGGFAVLWSDASVFLEHTEAGGNILMAAILEHALILAREIDFQTPPDLLAAVLNPVHAYAQRVTQSPALRQTFTLNALVGLDHAAWRLYCAQHGYTHFDAMIPPAATHALRHRHHTLARIPLLSYKVDLDEVRTLVAAGHFVLKIKLGAAGDPAEMLKKDLHRLKEIHRAVGSAQTPHTDDGRIRYYLDANGRYPDLACLERLMDGIDRLGMREQVLLLEEPLPEDHQESVDELGVLVAADESLHCVDDVRTRSDLGYGALALKPAGKTLSLTLAMAAEADRLGLACFVADSACTPRAMDFNRHVAARLAPLTGLRTGCLESNGEQHYRRWREMLQAHPAAGAPWLEPVNGVFNLDDSFYQPTLAAPQPVGTSKAV